MERYRGYLLAPGRTQSEDSYQQWRRSGMDDRFAYEKRYLYGRKAPVPATCDAVEALLRHELLAHIPEWLARKAGVLGCTSSSTILFMCWRKNLHTGLSSGTGALFGLGLVVEIAVLADKGCCARSAC